MTGAEEHAEGLKELESTEAPQSCNWNGADFPCLVSSLTRGRPSGPGGFTTEAALVLFVRVELFSAEAPLPAAKQTLLYNAHRYRIESVITPAGSPFVKLICQDAGQAT